MTINHFDTSKKKILAFLSVLIIGFIFFNSLKTGEASTKISEMTAQIVSGFVLFIFGKDPLDSLVNYFYTDFLVHIRIIAHFVEFFALGLMSTWFFFLQTYKEKRYFKIALFFGLFIAVFDETIQLFSDGRAFQIKDILIDMSGFFCAALFILIVSSFKRKEKSNQN